MAIKIHNTVLYGKKYHPVETVFKSNKKIVERSKIDDPNTQLTFLAWSLKKMEGLN
jgi:hypothetical protein